MANVTFTGRDVISNSVKKTLQMTVQQVADEVLATVQNRRGSPNASGRITPERTGYTRRQWNQTVKKTDFEVSNTVPWIDKLEAGASRQAPKGIIGPTLTQLKGRIK